MKKILVVDDSRFMRSWLKRLLSDSGYSNIIEAENGVNAIRKYKSNSPDLVIMDITMPVLDGVHALREIMLIDGNAKVIMCSSLGQQSLIVETIKIGAKDFVVKPYFKNLVPTINNHL
ncbi:response regulator [Fredinandcohnia sp. 179-A 10B2 NHS]|uniref:response regulator n=1 Tax=Fredinandcohnia sp. 179-A 10B2 NHS TaxID=3235176 RepID=UPI0039A0DC97